MDLRINKSVCKVIRLEQGASGEMVPVVLHEKKRKKKGTKGLKSLEKMARRLSSAQNTAAEDYQRRHDQSNDKKKDGWLKDLGRNLFKAARKGGKKIKPAKIFNI